MRRIRASGRARGSLERSPMTQLPSALAMLRDARLAAHATSAQPAWLWNTDGRHILWANAVGSAVFGAASAAELTSIDPARHAEASAQIARMAGALVHGAPPRLERLRGFGTAMSRLLVCACAR